MDVVIDGSGTPAVWSIYEKGTANKLGTVEQTPNGFMVLAGKDNFLTGVSLGPYSTKDEAMKAIAAKVGGSCTVGV